MNGDLLKATVLARMKYYKLLGDQCLAQLTDEDLTYRGNDVDNSIAVIVQHLAGNMLSRFTDFLTTDGEKPWRNRDEEFEEQHWPRATLLERWEAGWACFLGAVDALKADDWERTVYIRQEAMSVSDAVIRQVAHYPYHVGQIVHITRQLKGANWTGLSIAKGASQAYNQQAGPRDPGARKMQ